MEALNMRLRATLTAAAATALAASLAASTPALAATSAAHPSSSGPAQSGSHRGVIVKTALGFGSASRNKAAITNQDEIFICDPITYGILGMTPVTNSSGATIDYLVPYELQETCPIPMSMAASVTIENTTTDTVADTAFGITGFGEEVEASDEPILPISSDFLGTYELQMTLLPGFEWLFGPPQCLGIGTPVMNCTFVQSFDTPGSGSS
jgi:hypothetical protein